MDFYIGWHQPNNGESGCKNFPRCMMSVNRLENRKSSFEVNNWILDSGAFTRITSGKGHISTKKYAKMIRRWYKQGKGILDAAVSQDYMNEQVVHEKTRLNTKTHQELTILRYDNLMKHTQSLAESEAKSLDMLMAEYTDDIENPAEGLQEFWDLEGYYDDVDIPYIMPVLQGFHPHEYIEHIKMYGERLKYGAWVGVGTLCKRNGNPREVEAVLLAIKTERPDLELHGFGVKKKALALPSVRKLLKSADSAAHGLGQGRGSNKYVGSNSPEVALAYWREIQGLGVSQIQVLNNYSAPVNNVINNLEYTQLSLF